VAHVSNQLLMTVSASKDLLRFGGFWWAANQAEKVS
jgi:hypothetical protein